MVDKNCYLRAMENNIEYIFDFFTTHTNPVVSNFVGQSLVSAWEKQRFKKIEDLFAEYFFFAIVFNMVYYYTESSLP